uniref:G-protein coupled receptors family 1 profile domain-containing protein n=1 Tax=Ciona savignyi TaxID=51511 RepID=H2ZFV7_CIOSA
IWEFYLKPTQTEWFVISLYAIVFLTSIVGNCLTIAFILRRKHLRTTINYFMLNLALADIMVTIICLPPTLMVDFMESWLVGQFLCKFTPYLQMAVTSVSSLSLGAIALNRWFVVCHPLRVARSRRSAKNSLISMACIWLFSLITLCPVVFVTELTDDFPGYSELELLKSCGEHWATFLHGAVFHVYFVTVCFALPLVVMAIAYTSVFRKLSRTKVTKRTVSQLFKRLGESIPTFKRGLRAGFADKVESQQSDSEKPNLISSRKRSGRIQVALVIVYFLCYSPAMVLDVIRRTSNVFDSVHRESTYFMFAIAHLLMYLNSALNPIIYNCFSVQFRKEFRLTFSCCFP